MLQLHSEELLMAGGGDDKYLKVSGDGATGSAVPTTPYGVHSVKIFRPANVLASETTTTSTATQALGDVLYQGFYTFSQSWATAVTNRRFYLWGRAVSPNNFSICPVIEFSNPMETTGVVITIGSTEGGGIAGGMGLNPGAFVKLEDGSFVRTDTVKTGKWNTVYKVALDFKTPKKIKQIGILNNGNCVCNASYGGMYIKSKDGNLKIDDIPGELFIREEKA